MGNPKFNESIEADVIEQTAVTFPRWNEKEMTINLIMIIYKLKCTFEPVCCKFKNSILYLWSPWKKLIEMLYEDKDIKMDCKVIDYIDSYDQPNEPFFTKMICGFHVLFWLQVHLV